MAANGAIVTNRPARGTTGADYLTARIARDRPDVLARMKVAGTRHHERTGIRPADGGTGDEPGGNGSYVGRTVNMSEAGSPSPSKPCPHCGGTDLYTRRVNSGGGDGTYLLAGLGSFLHFAQFDVIVCADCGLTRLFAEPAARQNVRSSAHWKRL
jgi:hypothetical protein